MELEELGEKLRNQQSHAHPLSLLNVCTYFCFNVSNIFFFDLSHKHTRTYVHTNVDHMTVIK